MLDARDLDEMRDAIEDLLPSTCNLLTQTYTADGAGGGTVTWGTATAGVACRLDAQGGRDQFVNGAVRPFNSLILSLPYDTTITEAYRVQFQNETFIVTNATPLDVSWSLVKRVKVERVS
jgi:hypothetical protein